MPRGRAAPAPRSSFAAASRSRPSASSSPPPQHRPAAAAAPAAAQQGHYSQAPHAPPPMHAASAPVPAVGGGGGGGMFSGLMGSVVTGMAMGTGSAVAHRAVDGMMGPREVVHRHEGDQPAPAAAAAPVSATPIYGQAADRCENHVKAFAECMSKNNDMGACQYYFDAMQQCKAYA